MLSNHAVTSILLWIDFGLVRETFFSNETKEKLLNWIQEFTGNVNSSMEFRKIIESCKCCLFIAIFIPCSSEKKAKSLTLKVEPHEYFMDVIANHLKVADSSHVLISR